MGTISLPIPAAPGAFGVRGRDDRAASKEAGG